MEAAGRVAEGQVWSPPLRPPNMEVVWEVFVFEERADGSLSAEDIGDQLPQLVHVKRLLGGLLAGLHDALCIRSVWEG